MGRATVRAALYNYLVGCSAVNNGGDGSIPLLVGVIAHPEKQTLDEAFANIEDTNIATITGDATTATVVTQGAHQLQSGMVVAIIGPSIPGYAVDNATIAVIDAETFTYDSTETGDSSGGFVTVNFDSGAVIFMFLGPSRRARFAIGGAHNGLKYSQYELTLNVYLRSSSDLAEDADADNDDLIDDLIAAVEAQRNAGTAAAPDGDGSGVIWQWGEGPWNGPTDIAVNPSYPTLLSEELSATQVYTEVTITVLETINT